MKKMIYAQLGEVLYHEKLENGLTVYILPKYGFREVFATLTTNFGSIDNVFTPRGMKEPIKVPDGIAHFLEHKMFEGEDQDAFYTFGKQGASANAFTSFTRTGYLFSSMEQVEKNIETLLDFVQDPYFTDQSMEKEKGIIAQEIMMYADDPDWRAYFGVIENMFESHPVRIDVGGTIESITAITKENLYTCYETFYHPSNMSLFIIGAIDPGKIMEMVRKNQSAKKFPAEDGIIRHVMPEGTPVHIEKRTVSMNVSMPKCIVGYKEKDPTRQGNDLLKHQLSIQVVLDLMFSSGSKAYNGLYESGNIHSPLSYQYTAEWGFGFSMISGDSQDPDYLADKITETITTYQEIGFSNEEVDRAIKRKIGAFLSSLNSLDFIAKEFTRYQFNGMNFFDIVPALERLTANDLLEVLMDHFTPEYRTIFVIRKEGS
ncbi:EF-P 5-aminopentanol modification-associated protein YfmH [Thermoactinomyces sp. DSM 45892]|uniref:EF-P 5-aminopentanol modification-associated protein YfmH n=1 Tax=Thermoactinomyces sp. DSM 45892 TaxID=1882753 RepID=UPI00089CBB70|nr:pitrilysin family protein [Thermoactinomyces sp. DSM 45892]SDY37541.1 Predicted Zn-dependent peptidase [Thermoactinomyces sp. DSM 45892]